MLGCWRFMTHFFRDRFPPGQLPGVSLPRGEGPPRHHATGKPERPSGNAIPMRAAAIQYARRPAIVPTSVLLRSLLCRLPNRRWNARAFECLHLITKFYLRFRPAPCRAFRCRQARATPALLAMGKARAPLRRRTKERRQQIMQKRRGSFLAEEHPRPFGEGSRLFEDRGAPWQRGSRMRRRHAYARQPGSFLLAGALGGALRRAAATPKRPGS